MLNIYQITLLVVLGIPLIGMIAGMITCLIVGLSMVSVYLFSGAWRPGSGLNEY